MIELTLEQQKEDIQKRAKEFYTGLKKLQDDTHILLKAQIKEDGPVIVVFDTKYVPKVQKENNKLATIKNE